MRLAFGEAGFSNRGFVFFAPALIVFAALPLAEQLGCELLLSLESILPGADGAVAFVSGRFEGLTDAFELGLQT